MTNQAGKGIRLLAGAAGLVMVLAGAAAAAGPPAAAAAASPAAAAPAGRTDQAFLVTGQQVATGPAGISVRPGDPATAGQLQELRLGGRTYVLPAAAAAYLSRGLDPSLFEAGALARAESGGRLQVRVSYAGAAPSLPGVTITSASSGTARGYLTLGGARVFGAALERQFAGDHADAAYGQDGLFGNGVSIALAGAPTAPPAARARPSYLMHTLTVRGTTLSGRPDTGDLVTLIDADNASRFWTFGQDTEPFYHGIAKFSVPAGHFWVIGTFEDLRGTQYLGTRLVLPPEITVSRNTTVALAERAADSRVQFLTPRPAVVYSSIFERDYLTDRAPRDPNTCCTESDDYITQGLRGPAPYLYVSPMAVRPRVGTLAQITSAQLDSPAGARGVPYQYYVAYQARGRIPAQRFVVRPADLATERAGFYAAAASRGYLSNFESFPVQDGASTAVLWPGRFPLRLTMYLSAARGLSWATSYIPWAQVLNFNGGQAAPPQAFRPGQRLTDAWGAYPQHPAATVRLAGQAGPAGASATRAGNALGLAMTAFGDNTPGHTAQYIGAPFTVTARYQLDQDGTRVAGGTLRRFHGFADVTARLRPARSRIRFVLDATQPAALSPLSTASQTAWTWWSARAAHSALPRGWVCTVQDNRACAAQPLLTLRYGVAGEAVTGAVRPGRQVISLAVGHVQPSRAIRITRAAMSVSFNGGRTWHRARITGRGGRYTAAFSAPAGARVSLRTSAADAAGGAVTQTVARAYRIAAADRAARAACPPAGPRRARCFTRYAPQTAVNAALAAQAAGRRVAPGATRPGGWGAPAIESAYRLPTGQGTGQTVALVDAYSTPHLARDLGVYRREYGLPPCTTASGCLRIVNQRGQASPLPPADPTGWGVEETLDVSMVSAACPRCKIIVVEARSPLLTSLAAAEDTAARLGAQVISNSYGGRESGFSQAEAGAYRHRGHVIVASSGDFGFTAANFPANLADVTAVGGTQLARASNTRGWTETVYNGNGASGSGCSAYVAKPPWQHDPHCPGRTIADVAALASHVAVYDSSITRRLGGPWLTVYGTSAAAPIVAAVYALAGNAAAISPGYEYAHAAALFDVTKGNNDWFQGTGGAICGYDYLCVAKTGYDGPTGLGTPDGTGAF